MAPGFLKILFASMHQYLICILHCICSYVYVLFAMATSFSKANGAYVGVCPVHNHRVYRFLQACNYSLMKSI